MDLDCCGSESSNPECFPISVPSGDPRFGDRGCMNFSRTVHMADCDGTRQQMNVQSSYIDGSQIYGATSTENVLLRSGTGINLRSGNLHANATLTMNGRKLPVDSDETSCRRPRPINEEEYCGRSGDIRVNEQPGLAALHTLFAREHNRIAEALNGMNPDWNDDTVFQEARRIVVAEMQLITYREFLPTILSQNVRNMHSLNIGVDGFSDTYDDQNDATVRNEFAAAILRFGHSLIHRSVGQLSEDYTTNVTSPLEHNFFNPRLYNTYGAEGLEYILRWTALTRSPKSDKLMENSVRDNLFLDDMNMSMDLAALNIQRGRDHGIPGYNAFRELCFLKKADNFQAAPGGLYDHTKDCAKKLQTLYKHVDDIDLFTGAMSEKRAPNSILGPLQQCIIGKQFYLLKTGDRYFFERSDENLGFTLAQLRSIKQIRLSSIFCANTNSTVIQENMFEVPRLNSSNLPILQNCNSLPMIDLTLWADPPTQQGM